MREDGFQSGWKGRQQLDYEILSFITMIKDKISFILNVWGGDGRLSKYLRYGKDMINNAF